MKKNLIFLLVCMVLLGSTGVALAANPIISLPNPLCIGGAGSANCINSFETLVAAISRFVLIVISGLATLMFMWAGILFLTSGANPGNAEKAKHALMWAVIGVAVVAAGSGLILVIQAVIGTPPTAFLSAPYALAAVALPGIPGQVGDFNTIINAILKLIWPMFIGFAVIMFIIAGFLFLKSQGEPSEVKTARDCLIWGIVGVAIGVLAFSLPYFIQEEIMPAPDSVQGACCQGGTSCFITSPAICSINPTNVFKGLGTTCFPDPCL